MLGEIAEGAAGGAAPQSSSDFGGFIPFVRVSHLANDRPEVVGSDLLTEDAVRKHRLRLFPRGTILLPKSGASIRLEKRGMLPFDACLVSHLAAIIPDPRWVDRDYLFYWLLQKPLAAKNADGYPTLRVTDLARLAVPLPTLEQQ